MIQENFHQTIESQLPLLTEDEQRKVIAFIDSMLQQHRTKSKEDLQRLEQLIGIGSSTVGDGAEEHDHYVYGLPKKGKR